MGMTATDRRQAIIEALSARRCETREHLAQEFGVSIRTVTRDITHLSLSYPIVINEGRGGGIAVMDGFYLYHNRLRPQDIAFLERLSKSLSTEDQKTMQRIIKKLGGRNEKRRV